MGELIFTFIPGGILILNGIVLNLLIKKSYSGNTQEKQKLIS